MNCTQKFSGKGSILKRVVNSDWWLERIAELSKSLGCKLLFVALADMLVWKLVRVTL